MNAAFPYLVRRSLLVALFALGLSDRGQAKECYYTVNLVVVSAHGEQFILRPPTSSTTYGATWNFGTIHLSDGAYVRVINARMGDSMGDCSAYCQRDGVYLTSAAGSGYNPIFNCTTAGSYSGGATGDPFWGPTIYQFTIVDANTEPVVHQLRLGCVLQGTGMSSPGVMNHHLSAFIPCNEPYTALGYAPSSLGSETVDGCATLFVETSVVDWVHIDLLEADPPYAPVVSMNGLLHADHWVSATDGTSPLTFPAPPGNYRVRVSHRNHLPLITDWAVPFTGASLEVNFSGTIMFAMGLILSPPSCSGDLSGLMISGNANGNQQVSYVGSNNDRDAILVRIGGATPTATSTGYFIEDVNMDGVVKYVGQNNDRDIILQTIGGSVPTHVVVGQAP